MRILYCKREYVFIWNPWARTYLPARLRSHVSQWSADSMEHMIITNTSRSTVYL